MVECLHLVGCPGGSVTRVAQTRPPVAIVGAGAVAQALGRLMAGGGEPHRGAGQPNPRARRDGRPLHRRSGPDRPAIRSGRRVCRSCPRLATRVLIAVSDRGIEPVAEALAAAGMRSGVALHTCGARGPDALSGAAGRWRRLRHAASAADDHDRRAGREEPRRCDLRSFGRSGGDRRGPARLSRSCTAGGRSLHIEPDRLSYYHAGAVMASNAVMAALDAAVILLAHAGVERDAALRAIGPLARTSSSNALASGPQAALTGPIVRGDAATVAAHSGRCETCDPTVARAVRGSCRAPAAAREPRRGIVGRSGYVPLEDAIGRRIQARPEPLQER